MENKYIKEIVKGLLTRKKNKIVEIQNTTEYIERYTQYLKEERQELNQIEETLKILGYKEEE